MAKVGWWEMLVVECLGAGDVVAAILGRRIWL